MEYIEIKEQIKQKLPVARDLGDSENLLELGLSSLTIMRLVNQWRKQGVKVSFGSLMENPTLEGWWALIQRSMKKKAGKKRAQESKITPEKDMKQPFPLTDVQYAYWVGRDEEQALGGIDCHAYLEFDGGNIDPERLEKAWNVLQYHHPMLRACFLEDGTQKILDKPYCEKIKVHDFSRMSSEEAEAMAVSVRERLSHRKLKIEEGEVAGIELTLFPENRARMHVDMALLVADVQSLQILLRDLAAAYRGESLPAESKGWNFASYLERQKEEDKEERNNAEGYWKKRLEHLPKGPGLPLAKRPQEVTKTVFNRRIVRIGKEEWAHLQVRAKEYQTTPAMVLLTAYATVLERWSRNHRFLINIPFFNRKTEQQGLEDVIADFTTLLLLEIDCEGNPTFAELLDRIQKQLHEDMKYTAYSGVQVQRDLAQMYGDASAVAPVVFACNLGTPLVNDTFRKELGQFSYMISQTPQVWNDFQSYEDENGVQLTWDSVDKLFPENMIPDMLECFENLLHELGKKDWNQRFDVLPEKRKREIEDTARTGVPERVECLHWAVMNHAVARFAQPCQIGNFIDSFDWKLVVDVVTVFWNCYRKWFPAAFALSLIPVIGVFPVHEVFKVCFPALSVCIAGKGNILRGVDGWPVTGQRFVFVPVVHIPPAAFRRVRSHLLVKRLALMSAVRDKRIGDSKPFSLDGNCKGFALISFVPVRKIAECFQRNLHLVILFREQLFPNGQCRIVYPAVDCMIGV